MLELLALTGEVTAKHMFGGHGFFHDDLMFGLVADGIFYLKTDEENRAEFESRGLPPFQVHRKGGKAMVTSYWQCPEEALESAEKMKPWAKASMEVAERNRKPKSKGSTRTRRRR
ncbi:MAG: TfoX/Sxy family protein [Verrucomicrobiae bacterium]|nr:TfoX/Sxy family protein [Verrucomicrobiae bacterium]